jgi:hypothetical protein
MAKLERSSPPSDHFPDVSGHSVPHISAWVIVFKPYVRKAFYLGDIRSAAETPIHCVQLVKGRTMLSLTLNKASSDAPEAIHFVVDNKDE